MVDSERGTYSQGGNETVGSNLENEGTGTGAAEGGVARGGEERLRRDGGSAAEGG
jgi:hypothetical protein